MSAHRADRPYDPRPVALWLADHDLLQPMLDHLKADYDLGRTVPPEVETYLRYLLGRMSDIGHPDDAREILDLKGYVVVSEAADLVGFTSRHVRRLGNSGKIRAHRAKPGRPMIVDPVSLQDYERNRGEGDSDDHQERQAAARRDEGGHPRG